MSIGQQVSEEPSIEGLIAQVRGVIGVRVVWNAQQVFVPLGRDADGVYVEFPADR